MIALSTLVILAAVIAVPLAWLVPGDRAIAVIAAVSAVVLAAISLPSALAIIGLGTLLPLAMRWGERRGQRGAVATLGVAASLAVFVFAQLSGSIAWIGVAFFTLRQVHVLAEWWMGRISAPAIGLHLQYQLFLPAVFVGPVHRLPAFERQLARRRWDWTDFLSGAERVLVGAFLAELVGGLLAMKLRAGVMAVTLQQSAFLRDWAISACDWIVLYFTFAGMTAIALGLALMMGFKLEENFNRPWAATSLVDFWSRWHMSLTNWCRDYVFRPVMALTRSTAIGLIAAMLAIGLWHELSLYYVLWSFWQSLGIVLSRTAVPVLAGALPGFVKRPLIPLAILGWLALARPVITHILELL